MANSQVQKLETNVYVAVAPERVFDVFCNKTYSIAKVFPSKVRSIAINEGEWGTEGSIISWNYVHGKFYQQNSFAFLRHMFKFGLNIYLISIFVVFI